MRDLLIAVMTVSLCGGAVQLLAPEGRGDGQKQITFVTALCLCAVLFTPVVSALGRTISFSLEIPAVSDSGAEPAATVLTMTAEQICRELETVVKERYFLSDPVLALTLDDSDLTAVKVTGGRLTADNTPPVQAAAYLSDLLGCRIEAAVKESEPSAPPSGPS